MMATTLMIENINNDFSSYAFGRSEGTPFGSYYKFYQTKLRQLVTQTRYRREQEARIARQKQSKYPSINDNRINEQRLHKEYMNHIRERSKMQTREILSTKNDEQKKRSENVIPSSPRTIQSIITITNIAVPMEYRPKINPKHKQTPPPPKQVCIISTPTSQRNLSTPPSQRNITPPPPKQVRIIITPPSQRNITPPRIIPTIQIDCVDESLSKANIDSFTQASSSSIQNMNHQTSKHARKSILHTIREHINSHIPSDVEPWSTYDDIDDKFSSSIAPTVYQSFERNFV